MNSDTANPDLCQVDFYLLGDASLNAGKLACRLAMMAWERKQQVFICAPSEASIDQLDKLMWEFPPGRFLPHARTDAVAAAKAPVNIGTLSSLKPAEVLINLCSDAIPQPARFKRILEIVPFAENERQASRAKYKTYSNLGLKPELHEMNK